MRHRRNPLIRALPVPALELVLDIEQPHARGAGELRGRYLNKQVCAPADASRSSERPQFRVWRGAGGVAAPGSPHAFAKTRYRRRGIDSSQVPY